MIHRYCAGALPAADPALLARPEERDVVERLDKLIASVTAYTTAFQLSLALREIWEAIGAANRYIVTREPWGLAKDPRVAPSSTRRCMCRPTWSA